MRDPSLDHPDDSMTHGDMVSPSEEDHLKEAHQEERHQEEEEDPLEEDHLEEDHLEEDHLEEAHLREDTCNWPPYHMHS
jgi:hypothetical protein